MHNVVVVCLRFNGFVEVCRTPRVFRYHGPRVGDWNVSVRTHPFRLCSCEQDTTSKKTFRENGCTEQQKGV